IGAFFLAGCQTAPVAPAKPAAKHVRTATEDSGGVLLKEQAAYDVGACELDLQIFPAKKSIAGTATIGLRVVEPMDWLVLDLDPRFKVTQVRVGPNAGAAGLAAFEWRGARLWIGLG